VRGQIMVK